MLSFIKMHGLGNDFVLLDCSRQPFQLSSAQIQQMADRHRGIGFDQLLIIEPTTNPAADFHYRVFNADGQEVSQCGNGARCVGYYLHDAGLITKDTITLSTRTGLLIVAIEPNGQVTVNMGIPVFQPTQIPFIAEKQQLLYDLEVAEKKIVISALSMGNPHAVLKVDNVNTAPVATLGPLIEQHVRFPERVNVGFMEIVTPQLIRLRVYERGAGETLACGSGACAAVVAGRQQQLLADKVQVELTGGILQIQWQGPEKPVFMTGPATKVFLGKWLPGSVDNSL